MNTQRLNQYFLSWVPELSDPRLWVSFAFDVINLILRLFKSFVLMAPVVCFWFVIALLWTHPEPFGPQAVSMVFDAVKDFTFWSLTFTLTVILTVIYCLAVSSFGMPFITAFGRARQERLQESSSS